MRKERLELSRVAPLEPKSSASTSSATFALCRTVRGKRLVYNTRLPNIPRLSMRIFFVFVLYLVGCMLLSALLLPWLYPWFQAAFGATPDRSLYRFGMLLMLLGLPLLLRALNLRDRTLLGLAVPVGGWRRPLGLGLLWGLSMLGAVLALLLLTGVRYLPPGALTPYALFSAALSGLGSGFAVGLIEEFFFRGALQGGMRRTTGIWPSALAIGLFYAVVHFIRPTPLPADTPLTIASALGMIGGGLANLGQFANYADSFVTLVVAGIFLSLARERTGAIWFAIGAHAGWVTVIRIAKRLTNTDHQSPWIGLIGDYDNITGWLASGVLLGATLLFASKTPKRA